MMDITISDDSNFNTQKNVNLSTYEDLENALSRMWEMRTKFVQVIGGTLGSIKKGLDQNLQLLPGQLLAMELPNFTLMSTANITRKLLR